MRKGGKFFCGAVAGRKVGSLVSQDQNELAALAAGCLVVVDVCLCQILMDYRTGEPTHRTGIPVRAASRNGAQVEEIAEPTKIVRTHPNGGVVDGGLYVEIASGINTPGVQMFSEN